MVIFTFCGTTVPIISDRPQWAAGEFCISFGDEYNVCHQKRVVYFHGSQDLRVNLPFPTDDRR